MCVTNFTNSSAYNNMQFCDYRGGGEVWLGKNQNVGGLGCIFGTSNQRRASLRLSTARYGLFCLVFLCAYLLAVVKSYILIAISVTYEK